MEEFHLRVNTTCAKRVQTINAKMEMNAVFLHLFRGNVRTMTTSSARQRNSYIWDSDAVPSLSVKVRHGLGMEDSPAPKIADYKILIWGWSIYSQKPGDGTKD